MRKKYWIPLTLILAALLAAVLWERVVDALPIDQSHWLGKDGAMYHFGEKGDRDLGWYEEGGNRYYLDPARDGAMVTGQQEIDGAVYCFSDAGLLLTGWLEDEAGRRYLNDNGIMLTGWQEIDGQRYYFAGDGYACTGWNEIGGGQYYMDACGVVSTGWTELEDGGHFLDPDTGAAVSGWLELEDRYYLDENGVMLTGWQRLEDVDYYFLEDGAAAKGAVEIDGVRHYFTSTGAEITLVNRWNPVTEDEAPETVAVRGTNVAPACAEALERMLADCAAAGHGYRITSGYRSIARQEELLERKIRQLRAEGVDAEDVYAQAIRIVTIPGTSEHHLGLAVDIVDADYTLMNRKQASTETQKWLMEHCWDYGFILRYPDGSGEATGIIYEPWHYRYVGVELAAEMKEFGGCLEDYLDMLTGDGSTCGGRAQ